MIIFADIRSWEKSIPSVWGYSSKILRGNADSEWFWHPTIFIYIKGECFLIIKFVDAVGYIYNVCTGICIFWIAWASCILPGWILLLWDSTCCNSVSTNAFSVASSPGYSHAACQCCMQKNVYLHVCNIHWKAGRSLHGDEATSTVP